jgi:hypothetical protein
MGETSLTNKSTLENERQKCKTGLVREWVLMGSSRVNGECKEG